MATTIGRNAVISVSTDDSTYYNIGKVLSVSKSNGQDLADDTTNDSAGWKENAYADQQVTFDVTVKYDITNTAQQMILTEKYTNLTGLYVRFRPSTASGTEKQWKGLFRISSCNIDTSTGETEEMSVTFESSGTITYQTQP